MTNSTQLLILGNGFDLHCGLKSRYKDFFRSEILDTYTEYCGYPKMKAACKGFWEGLLFGYYNADGDKDYKWCDVESIIQKTLWAIVFGKRLNNGLCKIAMDKAISRVNGVDYSNINDPIEKYIYEYCVKFFMEFAKQSTVLYEEKLYKLLKQLLKELHNFERRFCNYLSNNIRNFQGKGLNNSYIINAINSLVKLTNFTEYSYSDIWQIVVRPENSFKYLKRGNKLSNEFSGLKNTYILSFNYTALFDILLVDCPCNYNNVHGKLCNRDCGLCDSSSVIFGIDDTLIQAKGNDNSALRIFSKTYRKMLDTAVPAKILPENDVPITIKFYGHSLSEADYSYFQSIFDYYNIYGNNNVDLIFYYSKGYEQTDAIYRLINMYGKTLNNQEQGKNLIHKLLLENRLKIQEID